MIYLLFFLSLVIYLGLHFYLKKLTLTEKVGSWKLTMVKGFKTFCLSFGLISLLFSIFQIWIDFSVNSNLADSSILQIEERLHWLKEKSAPFEKYKFWPDVIFITVLIACASIWPYALVRGTRTILRKKPSLVSGNASLVTLCSVYDLVSYEAKIVEKWFVGHEPGHSSRY